MNKAEITDGIVSNLIMVDPDSIPDWCAHWPDAPEPVSVGWGYDGRKFIEPPPKPAPLPHRSAMQLSFAQLLIGLVTEGWITEADGEGWLGGTLPPTVVATINLLPAENRFAAKARALRPSYVSRLDPLVEMMSMAQGRSPAEVDAFFQTYATV